MTNLILVLAIPILAVINIQTDPGYIAVPVYYSGQDLNAIEFELYHGAGLEYADYQGSGLNCNYLTDHLWCEIDLTGNASGMIYLYFYAHASSKLTLENVKFIDSNGNQVIGKVYSGYIGINRVYKIFLPLQSQNGRATIRFDIK